MIYVFDREINKNKTKTKCGIHKINELRDDTISCSWAGRFVLRLCAIIGLGGLGHIVVEVEHDRSARFTVYFEAPVVGRFQRLEITDLTEVTQ